MPVSAIDAATCRTAGRCSRRAPRARRRCRTCSIRRGCRASRLCAGRGRDEHRRGRDVEREPSSPPVPTMSTKFELSCTSTWFANSRITVAAAAISPIVSFFTRSPVMIAAAITGDMSPRMMSRIRCSISSWKISRCSIVRCSFLRGNRHREAPVRRLARARAGLFQEILEQRVAMLGQDRFRVELHAFDRQRSCGARP